MDEEKSVQEQIEAIKVELDTQHKQWIEAKLASPGESWRLGNNEFMLYCHVWALHNVLVDVLGVDADVVQLAIFEKTLEEMKKLFPMLVEARKEAVRQAIVAKIRPEI